MKGNVWGYGGLALMLGASLWMGPAVWGAEAKKAVEAQPPAATVALADRDGNKLFDSLEQRLQAARDDERVPVIVLFDGEGTASRVEELKQRVGPFTVKHAYQTLSGFAAELTKQQIERAAKLPFVKQIEYDAPVYATMQTASNWYGTAKARQDFGVDGDRDGNPSNYSKNDVVVAVIDTGIDANHVDLDGGKVIGWKDFVNNRATPYDDNGHGTHVAGIIAGEGQADARYKGVAPGAALVGVKVLNASGSGSMSTVTAAIDWCIQNKDVYGIRVLNLSLGTSQSSDGTDSTSQAVNRAHDAGLVVAVAAGNSGPGRYTIGSPGAAEKALTVGAMGDPGELGYFLADFSSRGYTADDRIKPDIAAPGYNITAPRANTSSGYVTYSGTSMATPFVAGTAALMLDANPSLTPDQVKSHLFATALDWGPAGKDIDYGYGNLNGYEAVKRAGGFSGMGPAQPAHLYAAGSLGGSGAYDQFAVDVTDTSKPLAVTLILPNWSSSTNPDFDLYLYNPSGTLVAKSEGTRRQETIRFQPTVAGTYTIRVSSYLGSGSYFFDVSVGGGNLRQTVNQ